MIARAVAIAVLGAAVACRRAPAPAGDAAAAPADAASAPRDAGDLPCPVSAPAEWQAHEDELRAAIDVARAAGADCGRSGAMPPAPPLIIDDTLQCAARRQARAMAARGFRSHIDPDGAGPRERAERAGYRARVIEDLAWGQPTAAAVVAAWRASPDHCAALLRADYPAAGIAYQGDGTGAPLWVLLVGAHVSSVQP